MVNLAVNRFLNRLDRLGIWIGISLRPKISNFIIDVDGVLTDGGFYYDATGKVMKKFGPDDADALKLLSQTVNVLFVSADSRGFDISKTRVKDMGFEIFLVSSKDSSIVNSDSVPYIASKN
jgi:3-deoxy-D-manno-octulosonate 8-phosphate phosphatase (KDO 8-P phosphatase)